MPSGVRVLLSEKSRLDVQDSGIGSRPSEAARQLAGRQEEHALKATI
jgi:hypothetical protein